MSLQEKSRSAYGAEKVARISALMVTLPIERGNNVNAPNSLNWPRLRAVPALESHRSVAELLMLPKLRAA
jgi:hypothetical protein